MPLHRKKIFRPPPPAPTTIYVRPGYNRVLADEFIALKVKRVALVADKVEAHSQGDLRENFGFKAAKDAIRQKVIALFPANEIEKFTEHFWDRIQDWRKHEEKSFRAA